MEIDEYETLVNELELRVDRLRSLFDQYFMGIERTTPNVPHKDVERRIQALRREQIRNTGLRFRFQMILQRYGTYQTYWQRICRQIEEGTYKRHVQKAREKILGPLAAAKNPSGSYDIDVEFDMEMMELEELGDGEPVTAVIAEAPVAPPAARPMWRKVEPGAVRQPPPAATAPAPPPAPRPSAPPQTRVSYVSARAIRSPKAGDLRPLRRSEARPRRVDRGHHLRIPLQITP